MTSRQSSIVTKILRVLGPGLLTGAADDDPSGIATYSQADAQLGFMLCWTMFLTTPFMVAIQVYNCRECHHEMRLTVWAADTAA
jgi:Mn2+/Fe2+ NRAMP family transporter